MTAPDPSVPVAERYPTGKILLAGLITIVIANVVNLAIFWVATSLFGLESTFGPFVTPASFVIFTTIFLLIATLVWWLIARRSQTPVKTFKTVALVALIVSMIPDVMILFAPLPPEMGTASFADVMVLLLMHVVSWYIAITALPRFSQSSGA